MVRAARALLLIGSVLSVAAAPVPPAAGVKDPGWHTLGVWRQAQGLPQHTVYTVLQTRDGYLWIGTRAGLSRFDGVRFTTWDNRNREQLRENEVWSLVEGDDGSLWIGTFGGGVSRLKDGKFTVYTKADGLVNDYVAVLAKDTQGAIWIGTDSGLSRFKDERFTSFTTREGLANNAVRGLYCDEDGSMWIGTAFGTFNRLKDGKLETPSFEGAALHSEVRSFWRDPEHGLWIATFDGLGLLHDGTMTVYRTADGLASDRVRQVYRDGDGHVWIVGDHGLDRMLWSGARPTFVKELTSTDLNVVVSDREGSLWVGSGIDGLFRLHRGLFATYSTDDGLADYYVATVLQDHVGHMWIGTRRGLSCLRDGRLVTYGLENGLGRDFIAALAEDHQGRLWVGTDTGLYRAATTEVNPHFVPVPHEPLAQMYPRVIFEDKAGVVWVGTDHQGLARYENDRLVLYTTEQGLPGNPIRALAQDKAGDLWIATRGGGLGRYHDGRFTSYTTKDGLAGDGVQELYIDGDETLWIATRQGLNRFKDGKFTTFTARDGLFSDYVYTFVEDDAGRLWMNSSKGVFYVHKQQLNDVAEGRAHSVVSVAYGLEHGLRCTVGVPGSRPGSLRTKDGRLWFGTNGGLSVVDPSQLTTNTQPPLVPIEEVTVDHRAVDPKGDVSAPPGGGDVEIRYTALSFLAPEKVRFKYKLEPYDKDWVDAGSRRVAYYTNLHPGRYTFKVKASNNDGVWNEQGASVALRLAPHFYQTSWFYGLCAFGLALAGAGTQRLRVERLKRSEQELSRRVDAAVAHVKVLSGLLPICASCKKVRDDTGYWNQIETYIQGHTQAEFSHSVCPECITKLYPEYAADMMAKSESS